ncbi:MAG TPA: F0F1 ATP synthase subunit B [Actinomycetota bacterium]|jgi:F-type H+-transporting ATPase subunit b|nr:F0F1 ATP synthase subunit B [Actinomycetota bacterium]
MLVLVAKEQPNPIIPDIAELIYGSVAFIIVFALLAKFAFPALNTMLQERTSKIQGDLEKAEQARTQAESELAEYRRQLADAREEANRIIAEAHRTADQLRRDMQGKAEQEASMTIERAQEEIRAERDRALQDLRAQVGAIAVDLAGRVVEESLDQAAHQRLIDEYIEQVAASNGGNGKGAGGR